MCKGTFKSIDQDELSVTDLRALLYLPSGQIHYKLSHNEAEWSDFEYI